MDQVIVYSVNSVFLKSKIYVNKRAVTKWEDAANALKLQQHIAILFDDFSFWI